MGTGPWLGENFFPDTDSGQFSLHVRAKTGTRIEETARLVDLVENSIRRVIPAQEVDSILDNIGLPYSTINYMHNTSGLIGAADADILVSLKENHRPTAEYVRELRKSLVAEFPGNTFYFLPADIVTQILNFGLPAPIDIQIEGANIQNNRQVADKILNEIRQVPGIVDPRIQQNFDYPKFHVEVDRTKAAGGGFTQRDVATSLLVSLSGSFQTTPTFFLNWQNGVNYNLATQTPQYRIQSLQDLQNMPITSTTVKSPEILADVASITRSNEMAVLNHYDIRRVVDVYASVQDRDLGAVGREITRIVDANRKLLPRGSFITTRGQLQTMRRSYLGLLAGLGFAIILVYLLIVVNFQSWLDPFIIITASTRRAGWHYRIPVPHSYHAQRPGVDGLDHVHGRRHRQQYFGRVVCQRAACRTWERPGGGHRVRCYPLSPRAHDRPRHDHRHGSHGAGTGRRR